MPPENNKERPPSAGAGANLGKLILHGRRWLPDVLAIAAACALILLAAYRIELPGLYYDEVDFVNAARGAPDNTMIQMRLGSAPIFIMPYLGALKAWIYVPVFRLFGVSALTIRLPAILITAVTLLIFFQLMRPSLGAIWSTIAVWIMAVDPANIFPSRLDWGPTVLMHFFQAAILGLWFSYRDTAKLWKLAFIYICAGLGFFDKFNFIWLVIAFVIGVCLCYPDNLKKLWVSSPSVVRWAGVLLVLIGFGAALYFVLPLLHFRSGAHLRPMNIQARWDRLLSTLSGEAVAYRIFGTSSWIVHFVPFWLIVTDCCLALACLFFLVQNGEARENRRKGFFLLLIAFLVFLQILITPQAGGPHHYSMIFPLPLLVFVFFGQPLYRQISTTKVRRFVGLLLACTAAGAFAVNLYNTVGYLGHFEANGSYNAPWSPAIYSLSRYVNERGLEAQSVICVDWGLHNQLHALAPEKLRGRMHDHWPTFQTLSQKDKESQTAALNQIFPEGKSFALTFAASKKGFWETRRNFLAVLARHPELKCRLVKEFWYGGEKIYEVYEVDRPRRTEFHHAAPQNPLAQLVNKLVVISLREAIAQPVLNCGKASSKSCYLPTNS
jgi:4-amino-4-deoxy-L-arabinose transferase-like glycosyltransferase